jgi:hypothetical protein
MILERKEEPKPEPSDLNLERRTGIATDTIPIFFSNWEPEVLHTNFLNHPILFGLVLGGYPVWQVRIINFDFGY